MAVRLINIQTGEELLRSDVNWKNLDAKSKEQYRVLGENEAVEQKPTYIPPELIEKKTNDEVSQNGSPSTNESTTNEAMAITDGKGTGNSNPADSKEETPEEKVIRLHKAGGENKDIAKATGLHWKTVESIINKSAK